MRMLLVKQRALADRHDGLQVDWERPALQA
jgi:hypothetical protein